MPAANGSAVKIVTAPNGLALGQWALGQWDFTPSNASGGGLAARRLGFVLAAKGSPSWFNLDTRPGLITQRTLIVANATAAPRTVVLAVTDARTAGYGGFEFADGAPAQAQHAPRRTFQLNLLSRAGIAVQINLPARGPGARTMKATDPASDQPPGARTRRLALTGAGIAIAPSGATVQLSLRNVGSRLIPTTEVELHVVRNGERALQLTQGDHRLTGWVRPSHSPAIRIDRAVHFGTDAAAALEQATGTDAPSAPTTPSWMWAAFAALGSTLATLLIAVLIGQRRRRREQPA